jgi:glycosyltransferase involved in cell wall biosynthesis
MRAPQLCFAGKMPDPDWPDRQIRVLMSVDAVGGVWRYAMELAGQLVQLGHVVIFVGLGPGPSAENIAEAEQLGTLTWLDRPLDWMVDDERELDGIADELMVVARSHEVDLLHLNAPFLAVQPRSALPTVVVSHSCVTTWFDAVHAASPPARWSWHKRRNKEAFNNASAVIAPSLSHATALRRCYGNIKSLCVVANCTDQSLEEIPHKEEFLFAAARWWDQAKNGPTLDRAARSITWPVIMAGATTGPNGEIFSSSNASCPGELPHIHARSMMSRAAIVASPSIYEPFGLVALEAAQKGAALVLADIPTYRELWEGAALFAEPFSSSSFAVAANSLITDKHLRQEMAHRAKLRASRFTPQAQCLDMLMIYHAVLQQDALLAQVV